MKINLLIGLAFLGLATGIGDDLGFPEEDPGLAIADFNMDNDMERVRGDPKLYQKIANGLKAKGKHLNRKDIEKLLLGRKVAEAVKAEPKLKNQKYRKQFVEISNVSDKNSN